MDRGRSRSAPHDVPEHPDAPGADPAGDPGLTKHAAPFPLGFASSKPFVGKGDDRAHRYAAGAGNSSDQPLPGGLAKKDQSFAYLLHPQHTLSAEAERGATEPGDCMHGDGVLDDSELQSGLYRAVSGLTEYVGTIFENVRGDDQRQDGADRGHALHPDAAAARPTPEQIRRLKAHMLRVAREQDLELSTAAIGWVYFEKLVVKGCVAKGNRRLVAAVCLLLSLKINEGHADLVSRALQAIQRRFEVSADDILDHEFSVFAELGFSLWLPQCEFMPHLVRMLDAAGPRQTLAQYLGSHGDFWRTG